MKDKIFITGGTGFLGTEVVARLLRSTESDIYVLVRAASGAAAAHRLRAAWQHDGELCRAIGFRVFPVTGDLTKPDLGLAPETKSGLQESIIKVYHCGAEIGFQKDHTELKEANITGTRNVLALASGMSHLKRIIHISTAFVAGQKKGIVREDDPVGTAFSSYYEKTKADAESLVRASGLPYSICRPSMIVGDSRTGYVKNFNTIYYVLKLLLLGKLRVLPIRPDTRLDMVPVDFVADAVVKIGAADSAEWKTFHLTCPRDKQPKAGELEEYVRLWAKRMLGTDLPRARFIPAAPLKLAGLAHNQKTRGRRKNFLSNLMTLMPYFFSAQEFDRSNTEAIVGEYNADWQLYIDDLLDFACQRNFMRQSGDTVFQQAQIRRGSKRYPINYYDVSADGVTKVPGLEANRRISRIRDALFALGVRRGDRVALTGINSVDYMCLEQAIGLIGAVSVPIYYTTPVEEIATLLSRSGSGWFFVGDTRIMEQIDRLEADVPVISFSVAEQLRKQGVMRWADFLTKGTSPAPQQYPDPADLATIRYTSGTTGEPKGVMFSFAQLAWMGGVMTELLPWKDRNQALRYLSFLPQSHVVEGILASYAPYYMLTKADFYFLNDFGSLTQALPKVRPSVFFSVPRFYEKVWEQVMASGTGQKWAAMKKGPARRALGKVLRAVTLRKAGLDACNQLIVGSAPISEELLLHFRDLGIEVHNAYGQTEAPLITINRMGDNVIPTIGTPLPETAVTAEPDGELIVKGPQVAMGYYGLETETIRDGVLRTGDLGTIHENGHITLHGRKKEMIITAYGKNISIPKIEGRLKNTPGVSEAVLIGENRPYCTALLWLESGEADAAEETRLAAAIDEMNADLSHPEQVRKFRVISQPLSIQAGELTPNLKVKRGNVEKHLKQVIDEMYES